MGNVNDFVCLSYFVYTRHKYIKLDNSEDTLQLQMKKEEFKKIMGEELVPYRQGKDHFYEHDDQLERLFLTLDPVHRNGVDWRAWRGACRFRTFAKELAKQAKAKRYKPPEEEKARLQKQRQKRVDERRQKSEEDSRKE